MNNKKAFFSTGRKKSCVAKIILVQNGRGCIKINNTHFNNYFTRPLHRLIVTQPLIKIINKHYDINCYVAGGGKTSQASSISNAISKILYKLSVNHFALLKKNNFLTRDSRIVERKKYGRAKARKRFQFSKR